jgi:hypothetical protein
MAWAAAGLTLSAQWNAGQWNAGQWNAGQWNAGQWNAGLERQSPGRAG